MFYLLLRFLGEENASGHITDADYKNAVSHLARAHRVHEDGHLRCRKIKTTY
jgi:hypothetical protein